MDMPFTRKQFGPVNALRQRMDITLENTILKVTKLLLVLGSFSWKSLKILLQNCKKRNHEIYDEMES